MCDNKDIPDECKYEIISTIAYYEHNLIRGRRNIIHLEAPIILIMNILYDYVKLHPEYEKIFKGYGIIREEEEEKAKTTILVKGRKTKPKGK